ncbi:MAG: glycerol-3-phosphate acyltransferase [Clostridiales bacterium]|nr:glycerol-3-phosphate acyltransferase [Clostridiales bacterium]
MILFPIIASLGIGYLLGSVVTAILISRLVFKEDVRDKGSGNSGATNAARVYGLGFGVLTFAGDLIKGLLSCLIGKLLGGPVCMAAAGAACMAGHFFPLWFDLRGGKGVSVGAALALMIDWRIFLAAIAVFFITAFAIKIVSAASIAATVTVGVLSLILAPELILKLLGAAAAVAVIIKHVPNIKRLIAGTEKRITFGGRRLKP